jgi:DNA-binding transcriptional MerR regulator
MGNYAAVAIPEKLFFKIGEVCDIVGVQAHVLRYWESEFSVLAPQKNRAGQRTYRKRDVETALRIKELLYDDQFTIAGAKKKIASEMRGGSKLKVVASESPRPTPVSVVPTRPAPVAGSELSVDTQLTSSKDVLTTEDRLAIRDLASHLNELLTLLDSSER